MAEAPSGPEPIRVTPTEAQAGQRIDRLLAETIGTLSRSRVKTLIEEGALSRSDKAQAGRSVPVGEPAEPARAGAAGHLVSDLV